MTTPNNNWHAFNWCGEFIKRSTKRKLLDVLGFQNDLAKVETRRSSGGIYETRNTKATWFIYKNLTEAELDGFNKESYPNLIEVETAP